MASADILLAAITVHKPQPSWDWVKTQPGAGPWLFALSEGVVNMWNAGVTGPGTPPWISPAPTWPHSHAMASLTSSLILAKLTALGYSALANTFFGNVASSIASYLTSSTVIAQAADGLLPHLHTFTTFGSASGLKSAILASLSVTGWGVNPMITAIASGIIDFLVANASMTIGAAPGHVHTLIV